MSPNYDLALVFASYCVAVIASFAAIYFSTRVRSLKSGVKSLSFFSGVLCLGGGIWSMHFVGMSAYHTEFEMSFDLTWTALSFLVALTASGLGLWVITLEKVSALLLSASAFIVGSGIFAMHYSGMIAMQMEPGIIYNMPLVILSGVIAVAASGAALFICRNIERVPANYSLWARLSAAAIMGVAICGMHYTGMAAVTFPIDAICSATNQLRGNWMGIPTAMAASIFLLLLVYIAFEDYREMERVKREKKAADEAVLKAAFVDGHSGLPNRASLENHVAQLISRHTVKGNKAFDVIYIELSEYRAIGQRHGDNVAQTYARQFAKQLQSCLPAEAYLARYNTNGFVAVFAEPANTELSTLAENIGMQLMQITNGVIANQSVRFGLGYSQFPQSGIVARLLIRQAQVIRKRLQPADTDTVTS